MIEIKITREKKKLVGCLINYYCVLNFSIEKLKEYVEFEERYYALNDSSKIIPISNGKTITIDITEEENEMYIVAFTSTDVVFSNLIIIDNNCDHKSYFIQTNYSFVKGTSLMIQEQQM